MGILWKQHKQLEQLWTFFGNNTNNENSYGHSPETTQTIRTAMDILWKQHEQWEQLWTFSVMSELAPWLTHGVSRAKSIGWNKTLRRKKSILTPGTNQYHTCTLHLKRSLLQMCCLRQSFEALTSQRGLWMNDVSNTLNWGQNENNRTWLSSVRSLKTKGWQWPRVWRFYRLI